MGEKPIKQIILYRVCFNKSKKKRKKKVKPFKNPNSSLFQNKTSGIHHSN